MGEATKEFRNRIVLIFDFDGTLAPNTIDKFVEHHGIDAEKFKKEEVQPLKEQGWDSQLANFYALLKTADRLGLDKRAFEQFSEKFEIYEGVLSMFESVRERARNIIPDVDVEFFLLTCGFLDIVRPMPVYKGFKKAWGCEFYFNEEGRPIFVKKAVSHPDKVRYILQVAKGLKDEDMELPSDVYKEIPRKDWYVPLDQVIYVGDGKSDMPAFSLMREHGGIAIGVVNAEEVAKWQGYESMHALRKIENLALADYQENSELMQSLFLGVESISKLIKLRKLGKGE